MTAPWEQAADIATGSDLEGDIRRAAEQLLEQARNPPPPEPCAHIEPYPGWARRQVAQGLTVVPCPWCGDPVRLPEF